MKQILALIVFSSLYFSVIAQKNVFLNLSPKVGGIDLQMATDYTDLQGTTFNLDHFDYYLSNVEIIHDGGQSILIGDTVFLVEPQNYSLYLGYHDLVEIEQINFGIGVPDNMNTQSGLDAIDISVFPTGHPLSFQEPSMHWGWTAGYMFMIVGGNADSNSDGIADQYFELHNLGNQNYANVLLPVVPTYTNSNQIDIHVNCNVDVWLKDIAIQSVGIVHGSSGANGDVMKNPETEAVFTQDASANIGEDAAVVGEIFFLTEQSSVKVVWTDVINATSFILTELNGKSISTGDVVSDDGTVRFDDLTSGVYIFRLLGMSGDQLNVLKVVR
ncbi:MAG: MbnP family protein [Flavobacteriales bacterium]